MAIPRQQPAHRQPIFDMLYISGTTRVQLVSIDMNSRRSLYISAMVTTAAYIPKSPPKEESPTPFPKVVIYVSSSPKNMLIKGASRERYPAMCFLTPLFTFRKNIEPIPAANDSIIIMA